MMYYYDADNRLIGFIVNGSTYYYVRNVQGDIIKILDGNMEEVVEYKYDTWGRVIGMEGSDYGKWVGSLNPFRYRGYYYDDETGMYYLITRYYNPEWGRFINADGTLIGNIGSSVHNIFAYASNNPVVFSDPSGTYVIWYTPSSVTVSDGTNISYQMDTHDGHYNINNTIYEDPHNAGINESIFGGSIVNDIGGNGWKYRIDSTNTSTLTRRHIKIYNDHYQYSQNDDGTPHDDNNNSPGDPPGWITKKLKKQGIWDWYNDKGMNGKKIVQSPYPEMKKNYDNYISGEEALETLGVMLAVGIGGAAAWYAAGAIGAAGAAAAASSGAQLTSGGAY